MMCFNATRRIAALIASTAVPAVALAQQAPAQPSPTAKPAQVAVPQGAPAASTSRRTGGGPQGFSVVLVLGDLQGAPASDDVPAAARKALTDMRDFLPFKSYRLLDAAWLMCCGEQHASAPSERRSPTEPPRAHSVASQVLRGPDDQEYELRLSTSRAESSRVFVNFTLFGTVAPAETAASATSTAAARSAERQLANQRDRVELLQRQIQEEKKRVEVGVSPGTDIAAKEVEVRRLLREMQDLEERVATGTVARGARGSSVRTIRSAVIDTSFTMDVGETVVVGTSRLKGGTRALIALLTAVPPRGAGQTR